MRALAWDVHDASGIDVKTIGASTWVPSGIVLSGGMPRRKLHRLARERVNDTPVPSGITWIKGKGVIGRCWRDQREQLHDAERLFVSHGNCSRRDWDALGEDERMGMSHGEFQKIAGKYGTVIAVPLIGRGEKVIGVVALDAPMGTISQLSSPDVTQAIGAAARVVSQLITK
jgi:hypothetical protein